MMISIHSLLLLFTMNSNIYMIYIVVANMYATY